MPDPNTDPDYERLEGLSLALRAATVRGGAAAWFDSPFGWILSLPSSTRGAIGKRLVEHWCTRRGFTVTAAPGRGVDRLIDGHRVAIKFSRLWESGEYKFQQIRDQSYEFLFCLGVSPHAAHAWLLPKTLLDQHVIGHTGQHTGAAGHETAWISLDPSAPPEWITGHGGRLSDVERLLTDLRRRGAGT